MTAVIFKFSLPDGTPVADAPFLVTTRKPSFDETLNNGIQVSGDVSGITDAQGEATLTLMAGFAIYYLLMDNPGAEPGTDGCTAGLRYRFMVPESAGPVRVEDLIVTTPTWSRPWDETALQIIIDAKVSATASADAAHASELAAGEFAVRAEDAESASALSAQAAAASELNAGQSKDAALADMLTTEGYRNEAGASKDAARVSELAAAASADFAAGAVVDMQEQVDEATLQAGNAATSAINAAASEDAAEADRLQTAQDVITTTTNKNATAADVVTITGLKSDVVALKDETLGYRDDALEALGAITGVIADGGPIDLSGGAYPAKPAMSTVWQVTVAGTVDTITYNVGDQLFYTKDLDYFYQMDNTSQVRTVAGRMGDVVLAKDDVGLPLVDNTADADKPISTAQATGLGLKIDKASIVDDLNSTDATKVLSAKQGKALYDLMQANNATLVVYEFTATLGQTVFSGADDNGLSLVYQAGPGTLVFLNGVQLQKTDDYTATTGTSLTMVNPALQAGDLVQVLAFGSFSVADHYTMAQNDVQLAGKADKTDTDTKFADRYTKAEDDARFVQKTAIIDVAHGGTGNNGTLASLSSSVGWDTINTPGEYFVPLATGTNVPQSGVNYTVKVVNTANGLKQVAMQYGTAVSYSRSVVSGSWGEWYISYGRNNIVGPVSQTAGVPTGAIVETGSNANGSWTKWADGTMICEFISASTVTTNLAYASLFQSSSVNYTLPVPFVGSYTVAPTCIVSVNALCWAAVNGTPTSTVVALCAISVINSATTRLGFIAKGRWY